MKVANNEWEKQITDYYFEIGYILGIMVMSFFGAIGGLFAIFGY